jgi:hypothetical protein
MYIASPTAAWRGGYTAAAALIARSASGMVIRNLDALVKTVREKDIG